MTERLIRPPEPSRIEKANQQARENRQNLIETWKKEAKYTSVDLATALENLHTRTAGAHEVSTLEKAKIVTFLGDQLEESMIESFPGVYLGAGTDVEFPLLFRLRKIIMVDTPYPDEDQKEILERIKKFDPNPTVQDINPRERQITFQFDFGNGKESTQINLAREYNDKFEPSEPVGMVIGYQSGPEGNFLLRASPSLLKNLSQDGYIFDSDCCRLTSLVLDRQELPAQEAAEIKEKEYLKNFGLKQIKVPDLPFVTAFQVNSSKNFQSILEFQKQAKDKWRERLKTIPPAPGYNEVTEGTNLEG